MKIDALVRAGESAAALTEALSDLPAEELFEQAEAMTLGSFGATVTYAIMYKSADSRLAGNGWLWAEINPNGSVGYSISNRGAACTGCHSLERGPQNDSVRTFERQR